MCSASRSSARQQEMFGGRNFSREQIFASWRLIAKIAKISASRKFPAIRYTINDSALHYIFHTQILSIISFIVQNNKVIQEMKGILVSTLESFVLQSEQYHPVAQINLHKGLKCKIKIITSVRPQSTILFSAIQLAGSLFPQLLCRGTRQGYQEARGILMNFCQG